MVATLQALQILLEPPFVTVCRDGAHEHADLQFTLMCFFCFVLFVVVNVGGASNAYAPNT
jgi:hypothetical protein